jgi:hypothetical protein
MEEAANANAKHVSKRPFAAVHASPRRCGAASPKRTLEQARSILSRPRFVVRNFQPFAKTRPLNHLSESFDTSDRKQTFTAVTHMSAKSSENGD